MWALGWLACIVVFYSRDGRGGPGRGSPSRVSTVPDVKASDAQKVKDTANKASEGPLPENKTLGKHRPRTLGRVLLG